MATAVSAGSSCPIRVPAFPQPILERIFEPFVTSKEHGTGLGLAVSHRIAKEHGGTLLANNRTEGGAMFTLELPLQARACAHAQDGPSSERTASHGINTEWGCQWQNSW